MNNKGFAITSIIYGLMLLFVVVITSLLSVLIGRGRRNDELLIGIRESLEYPEISIKVKNNIFCIMDGENCIEYFHKIDENNIEGIYVTEERGKYIFTSDDISNCEVFLPKNVVIITSEYREPGTLEKKLYYNLEGGEDKNLYKDLCSN